jgi:Holliday junction resolvase-like predicted endonuclease
LPKVGDIIMQDDQEVRVIDVKTQTYDDGTVVTAVTTEPVV